MNHRLLSTTLLGVLMLSFMASTQAADPLGGASPPRPQMKLGNTDKQYKRIHQFALRLALLRRTDEAEEFLKKHLERHPKDPESHYMLGLIAAQTNRVDDAVALMEQAIDLGLPAGRVIAGPRGVLGPLANTDFYKKLVAQYTHELVHGPMVGNVTDHSASIWIRTALPCSVSVVASESADLTHGVTSKPIAVTAESDYTGVAVLAGLKPSTEYHYAVLIDGKRASHAMPNQRIRTFPTAGASSKFSLVFGGGAGYVPENERAWTTIESFDPLALLLLGDNVYIDDPESLLMIQYTYQRRQSRPEFRQLTSHTAVFTIWDDHDFGTNDCWGGPLIDVPAWKKQHSWKTFCESWPNPAFGGGEKQPGCWYSFAIGDVDFVMLDCRYYRTNPREESPTMLGPVQMQWLKQTLPRLDGTFKVICSSVPWDFRTKGSSRDTWNGFQAERESIFQFIEKNGIEGVVLMSADRHRSDAWCIERPDGYNFYEFNSSRLTNQHVHGTMEKAGAIFSYNAKQSFGLVTFDTKAAEPTVKYQVITIDGESVHELSVRHDQLKLP